MTTPDAGEPLSADSTVDVLERAKRGDRAAAIDLLMRRGIPVQVPDNLSDHGLDPETRAIVEERSTRFLSALRQLRPEDRQVIIWRLELGYSFKEIAEQLNKSSPDAARMHYTRAVARLRTEMGLTGD